MLVHLDRADPSGQRTTILPWACHVRKGPGSTGRRRRTLGSKARADTLPASEIVIDLIGACGVGFPRLKVEKPC